MSSPSKKRKNQDGSVNLEGYSPFAARISDDQCEKIEVGEMMDCCISRGAQGDVFCIYTVTLGICVWKRFRTPHPLAELKLLSEHDTSDETRYQHREVKYTSAVDNHPNILRFFGYTVDKDNVTGLIVEYMAGGSLARSLSSYGTPTRIYNWALQIARALAYCHERGAYIRVNSSVLLDKDGETVKLCDFGFARPATDDDFTSNVGTPAYMAPEVILSNSYNFKADVWSYGMFLYALTHKRLPFTAEETSHLHTFRSRLEKGERPKIEFDPQINVLLYFVMENCWHQDPNNRPTMINIVKCMDPKKR